MKPTTQKEKIKQLLSKSLRDSGMDEDKSISPVIRELIFSQTPDTDEFWLETVPEIIVKWLPELKNEIVAIKNPTIAKFVNS